MADTCVTLAAVPTTCSCREEREGRKLFSSIGEGVSVWWWRGGWVGVAESDEMYFIFLASSRHDPNVLSPPALFVPKMTLHQTQPAGSMHELTPHQPLVVKWSGSLGCCKLAHPLGSFTSTTIEEPGSSTRLSTGRIGSRVGNSRRFSLRPDMMEDVRTLGLKLH